MARQGCDAARLDRDSAQSVEKSVAEIERCAKDRRFVQVLMLVMGDNPLGKRAYWPIYAAAERLGLVVGVHAGSAYHNPPTSVGWGSYHVEDYVAQAQAFQTQLTSLIIEGVFARHPKLKMVMLESGFTWLPSYLWRLHKFWRGVRMETPGSTARRWRLCAATSAFRCNRSTRRRIRQP
jgi:predicted TIM-barrel fold metal-dependent hydrolase